MSKSTCSTAFIALVALFCLSAACDEATKSSVDGEAVASAPTSKKQPAEKEAQSVEDTAAETAEPGGAANPGAEQKPPEAKKPAEKPSEKLPEARHTTGFVKIEPGNFMMGEPDPDPNDFYALEQRQVTIERPFLLKKTEVTKSQYLELMDGPDWLHKSCDDCPIDSVSWDDAITYLNKLSEKEGLEPCYDVDERAFKGLDCEGYRLPTEAEWEYAARAGNTGDAYGELDEIAWCEDKSELKPVGIKKPNAWGLYDMVGNVSEWTGESVELPEDEAKCLSNVAYYRGASTGLGPERCRVTYRKSMSPKDYLPGLGFRWARTVADE